MTNRMPSLALSDESLSKRLDGVDIRQALAWTRDERAAAIEKWLSDSYAWSSRHWCIDMFFAAAWFSSDGLCVILPDPDKKSVYSDSDGNHYSMGSGPYLDALKRQSNISNPTRDFILQGAMLAASNKATAEATFWHLKYLSQEAMKLMLQQDSTGKALVIGRKVNRWLELLDEIWPDHDLNKKVSCDE